MPEPSYQIQHQTQDDADQDRGSKREIYNRVFAAKGDVTRETSDWQVASIDQHEKKPNHSQNKTGKNESSTNAAHNVILLLIFHVPGHVPGAGSWD